MKHINLIAKSFDESQNDLKENLPLAKYNWDSMTKINLITLIDFIEHFNKSQGSLILSKCSKLLEGKGGTLIVGTPSVYSSKFRSKRSRIQHIHEYDGMELKDLCSKYFNRTFLFSMNDEVVHTGFYKLAWFNFVVCVK